MTGSSRPGKARSARVYDYLLGGSYSTTADREAGDRLIRAKPGVRPDARANRRLLTRMIGYLAGHGITQYLDIGCGLPAAANTHEVAQSADPAARIVYVDSDPDVVTYARALMASSDEGTVGYLQADLRSPQAILTGAGDTLDFSRPVAILLLAVLHQLPDTQAVRDIVAGLAAALPAGGYLAISHPASDINPRQSAAAASIYQAATGIPQANRTRAQVAGFFDGLDLIDPGIVPLNHWRPDQHENPALVISAWAGLGIRRLGARHARAGAPATGLSAGPAKMMCCQSRPGGTTRPEHANGPQRGPYQHLHTSAPRTPHQRLAARAVQVRA